MQYHTRHIIDEVLLLYVISMGLARNTYVVSFSCKRSTATALSQGLHADNIICIMCVMGAALSHVCHGCGAQPCLCRLAQVFLNWLARQRHIWWGYKAGIEKMRQHDPGLANAFVWAETLPPKGPAQGPQRSRSAAAQVAMRYYRERWKE